MTCSVADIRRSVPLAAALIIGVVSQACNDDRLSPPLVSPPSPTLQEPPDACQPEVFTEQFGDDSSKVLTTAEGCYPGGWDHLMGLNAWGIDLGCTYPWMPLDTPQGQSCWQAKCDDVGNLPSGVCGVWPFIPSVPIQSLIEFDPPVRAVDFEYSLRKQTRAWWPSVGMDDLHDSVLVEAWNCSNPLNCYGVASTKLYANVDTYAVFDTWSHGSVKAWGGDRITHLNARGRFVMDNLEVTRGIIFPDTSFWVSVDCNPPPVTRADTVTCQASWNPSTIPASEINFAWRFESDSSRVFPDPTAEGFPPPQPIDSSGTGVHSWSGAAVLGGEVTLTATWQAAADTESTQFAVNPRTGPKWGNLPTNLDTMPFWDIPTDSTVPIEQQPNPTPGFNQLGVNGLNLDSIEGYTGTDRMIRYENEPEIALVPSGPNRGLAYISDPGNLRATRTVALRTWLTGREAPKFQYECADSLLTNRGLLQAMRGNRSCGGNYKHRHDSTAFRNGVVAHETYGSGGAKGHQGQIELAAASLPTCGRVPTIIERVVAEGEFLTGQRALDVINEGRQSLFAASDHYFVYGNFSNAPSYQVVESVTVVDYSYADVRLDDMQQAAQPDTSYLPDERYKCSRNY